MDYNIIKEIDLDFYSKKIVSVDAKQYDINSRYILITCHNQGSTYSLDKDVNIAYIRYKKKDENIIFNTCEITDEGKVLVELTQQMLAAPGNCVADLLIVGKDEELHNASTMTFYVNVLPAPYPNEEVESSDEFNALQDLMYKVLTDYEYVMENAQKSADNAAESEKNAKESEKNAAESANEASTSASNAKDSEDSARESATSASDSATTATNKAKEASDYATEAESYAHGGTGTREGEETDNGLNYKNEAEKSASEAKTSADNAKQSETNAGISETNAERSATESAESASQAKISEENAKTSETNSADSADRAKESEDNAMVSEENANKSAEIASSKATDAENSASAAKTSEDNAKKSELKAEDYSSTANEKATDASNSASQAAISEQNASVSANNSENWSNMSKSYAVGTDGEARENDDIDNAKYYYEQTLNLSRGINGIIPMGNITFDQLALIHKEPGYMFNVTEDFVTDDTFNCGAGKYFGAGNNIIWTAQGNWDVTAASTVTGAKGNAESSYRQGNVDIAPSNLMLENSFAVAAQRANIQAGDTLDVAFGKLARYCADLKNVAFSGSYNDLTDQPNIPSKPEDIGALAKNGTAVDSVKWNGYNIKFITESAFQALGSKVDSSTIYFRSKG